MDDEEPRATRTYEAELVPRTRRRLPRLASAAGHVVFALLGGLLDLPFHGDVVVRRRADGGEVLRVPVDNRDEAGQVLTEVQEQLARLGVEEFRERWSLA